MLCLDSERNVITFCLIHTINFFLPLSSVVDYMAEGGCGIDQTKYW